jgi:hypothetical protein
MHEPGVGLGLSAINIDFAADEAAGMAASVLDEHRRDLQKRVSHALQLYETAAHRLIARTRRKTADLPAELLADRHSING